MATCEHVTTGEPATIIIEPHTTNVTNDGTDSAIFLVYTKDIDNNIVPTANDEVLISLSDNVSAEILAVSNGDPMDQSAGRGINKLFNGYLQVVVRVNTDAEQITLNVDMTNKGISAHYDLPIVQVESVPTVQSSSRALAIDMVRAWSGCSGFDDINKVYNFDDMNTSEPVTLGTYKSNEEFLLFTAKAVMPECNKKMDIVLVGIKGEYTIRVFHDTNNVWPHPSPQKVMDIKKSGIVNEKEDLHVPLNGFHSNEKIKVMLLMKNEGSSIDDLVFMS